MADTAGLMVLQHMNYLPENRRAEFQMAYQTQKKDRTTALVLSLFFGSFGVDRFYLGQTGLGVAKLLTCGGLGLWSIIDWILIMGAADQKNMQTLTQLQAVYPAGPPALGYGPPPHGYYPPSHGGYGPPPGR